jgi:hypothetical protein
VVLRAVELAKMSVNPVELIAASTVVERDVMTALDARRIAARGMEKVSDVEKIEQRHGKRL